VSCPPPQEIQAKVFLVHLGAASEVDYPWEEADDIIFPRSLQFKGSNQLLAKVNQYL
jgi:hypothetical protein